MINYNEIEEEISEDLALFEELDNTNALKLQRRMPHMHGKYMRLMFTHKNILSRMKARLKSNHDILVRYYAKGGKFSGMIDLTDEEVKASKLNLDGLKSDHEILDKTLLEQTIEAHPQYSAQVEAVNRQQLMTDQLEYICKNLLKEVGWNIRTILDFEKFNAGL